MVRESGRHRPYRQSLPLRPPSSEAFLDQLHPSLALVSAGENNRYKHPNDETLERFKQRHIKVLRTDKDGAIRFKGWFKWSSETVR